MSPAKGTSSVRKHEQQSQERKMMQKKLPKTETKKNCLKWNTNKQTDRLERLHNTHETTQQIQYWRGNKTNS